MARAKKHAAYCGTRNVYGDMETAAKSLIAMSDVDVVHFLIEDAEFPTKLPSVIQCHDVSGQTYFPPDCPNAETGWTYMVLMRTALCHVLPRVGKVLSLDCDTVCMDDVSSLWELPVDDCYYAAVPEWHKSGNGLMYCNAGVALYNLRKLRDGKADECIGVLNRRRYTWPDQDVLNFLCQGRINDMPSCYNSNWWTDKNAPGAKIVHFAGVAREGWVNDWRVTKWRDMSWDEVMALHESRRK